MTNQLIKTNIVDNLIKVMTIAVQNSSYADSGVAELDGSLRYYSGCEFPFFNGVFNNYKNNKLVIKDDLDDIINFYATKKMPFIWWWTQDSDIPDDIKVDLDAKGFQFIGDFLGIAAKLDDIKFSPTNSKIEIVAVNTHQEYEIFLTIICNVFQLSESIKSDFKQMYKSYGPQGQFKHYLAYYEGQPVTTLTTYIDGPIVGLYNGATLVDFQKNGLCAAIAHFAIKEAMDFHCEYAVSQLMAPGMAKGLSEKMGFNTHCLLLPFLKNPPIN